tara:strand:- start:610 stop:2142 length:1533 start_codon:yes stop_codon:yes gene_type:complete
MKNKIFDLKKFYLLRAKFKRNKKKIILCHGVFDVLHYGHILHFREAKKLNGIVVVSVTADKFVNKGPHRPVFKLETRMKMLESIEEIDYVIPSLNQTPIENIKKIKPDIYFKGKDYMNEKKDLTGNISKEIKAIKSVGGQIKFSTSDLMSSSRVINQTQLNLNKKQKKFIDSIKNKKNFSNETNVINVFESFKNLKVLIIGESIIDQYIFCESMGKSGKEPVLVLRDLFSEKYLGGAAAIANNLAAFSSKITLLSCVGQRREEKAFINRKLNNKISSFFLEKKNSPTIIKKRYLDEINKSKVLGVYSLNDQPLDKNQEIKFTKKVMNEIKKNDIIIVSDYGHGLISKDLAKKIVKKSKFLAVNTQVNASNVGYHVISKYIGANFVTINETELRHEVRDKNSDVMDLIKKLSNILRCNYANVTCGKDGAYIYDRKSKKMNYSPAFASKVIDKVGTGDTMMILATLSLYKKVDINFAMFISAISAAENISNFANKKFLEKNNFIKSILSYLK